MFTHNGSVHNIFQFKPNKYIFTILINCSICNVQQYMRKTENIEV